MTEIYEGAEFMAYSCREGESSKGPWQCFRINSVVGKPTVYIMGERIEDLKDGDTVRLDKFISSKIFASMCYGRRYANTCYYFECTRTKKAEPGVGFEVKESKNSLKNESKEFIFDTKPF